MPRDCSSGELPSRMAVKNLFIWLLLVTFTNAQLYINDPKYCYSWDPVHPQIKMFGTVTPYDELRARTIDAKASSCKPERIWFQGRHGSRYPSTADTDNVLSATDNINNDIIQNYVLMKTTLCPADVEVLRNWVLNPNFTLSTAALETESGWTELTALGQRLQAAFPELLPREYCPRHYYFRHSPLVRTLESAKAFARGLFGPDCFEKVTYEGGSYPDMLLLPFYSCPEYISILGKDIPEQVAFAKTPEFVQMLEQVNTKLGFLGAEQKSAFEIEKLITHCRYEQMYDHTKPSAFCAAFSYANHEIYEYYYDLLNYFRSGYGYTEYRNLYENLGCTLLQEILKYLMSNDLNDQKAKILYGHDVTLQLLFVTMGFFEDKVPLRADNFAQQSKRQWKASLTPMGGNMAIIKYK